MKNKDKLKTLDELKKEFNYKPPSNKRLAIIDDLVNEKLLELQRSGKNRLLIISLLPELFLLTDKREKIERYNRKFRLKLKVLRIAYRYKDDKKTIKRIDNLIERKIKKQLKIDDLKSIK